MAYEPIEGRDVTLFFMKGVDLVPYVCVENFSMDFNKTTKETKTQGTGNWTRPRTQRNGYSINCSGLIPLGDDPADFKPFELLDYFMADSEIEFRAVWKVSDLLLKVVDGVVLVTSGSLTGNATDFADANFTLQGVGLPVVRDTLDICDAVIGPGALDVTIANEGGGNVTLTVNNVTGGPIMQYNYTVDGGGTLTSPTNSWFIGHAAGEHTVIITPICENGEEGEPRVVTYTSV